MALGGVWVVFLSLSCVRGCMSGSGASLLFFYNFGWTSCFKIHAILNRFMGWGGGGIQILYTHNNDIYALFIHDDIKMKIE